MLHARRTVALTALMASAALGAPSPLVVFHQDEVASTFELQSIRYAADGVELFKAARPGPKGKLGAQHLSPGLHTLSVELVYLGHSPVFSYLSSYRFHLRSRATVFLNEGDGLELRTQVRSERHPTEDWQKSLQWRLTGSPRRAILDVENLPIEQERLDGPTAAGPLQVSSDVQSKDDAQAEKTVREVLQQADLAAAPPSPGARHLLEAAACKAPDIHFEVAQFQLSKEAQDALWSLAGCLGNNPSVRLVVEGHCDRRGSSGYNVELGQWRADSVVRYLLLRGAAAYQLEPRSYGNLRLKCAERTEACHAENRRVQFSPPAGLVSSETP